MQPANLHTHHRTDFFLTQGDDQIYVLEVNFINRFRSLTGRIDANVVQDLECERIDLRWPRACTQDTMLVAETLSCECLGDLASCRIGYAKKEDGHYFS